jgi:lipoprotein-anchoring transpeptidase ErfK/SrfK
MVDKPTQTMTVTVDSHVRYRWRVSTGATDRSYTPFRMELMHYSREWDNAGMPHAIFFTQRGHSIHGSDHPGLGTAVSHGVRLTLSNAATLYRLVNAVGMANTKVVVSGHDPPASETRLCRRGSPVGLFGGFFRF